MQVADLHSQLNAAETARAASESRLVALQHGVLRVARSSAYDPAAAASLVPGDTEAVVCAVRAALERQEAEMRALGDRLRKEAAEAQQRFDDELARKAAQEMLGAQQLHELECASDVVVWSLYGVIETNYLRTGLLGHTHRCARSLHKQCYTHDGSGYMHMRALTRHGRPKSTAPDISCACGAACTCGWAPACA